MGGLARGSGGVDCPPPFPPYSIPPQHDRATGWLAGSLDQQRWIPVNLGALRSGEKTASSGTGVAIGQQAHLCPIPEAPGFASKPKPRRRCWRQVSGVHKLGRGPLGSPNKITAHAAAKSQKQAAECCMHRHRRATAT